MKFKAGVRVELKPGVLDAEGNTLSVDVHGKAFQTSSALTAWAFQKGFGRLGTVGNYVVTFCVFLFALSTIISCRTMGTGASNISSG